jgi:hypothetical protein
MMVEMVGLQLHHHHGGHHQSSSKRHRFTKHVHRRHLL